MDAINRTSKLPLYQQLYEVLRSSILHGEWKPGDLIPSESELTERYQVSRITVRQVLDMLAKEGLIYRERGRGTFVAHPTVDQVLVRIVSFTEDMQQRGFEPSTRVLSASLVPAPTDIAAQLQIEPDTELVRLERLRLADGEPMSVEESYLIHRFCPGLLERNYTTMPLREALEKNYGIHWSRATQVIRAISASRDLAGKLSIRANAAVLFIERVSYSQQNTPIEFLRLYNRGDRYALQNELRG
jgi:DNA-binding GntR family transcriptional regulator